ncbi:hypothetical protein LRR80_05237 [Streptomyces sp. RO-S4]|nr:hypothetical protein [Streptomyces sp. RO-S4]
MEEFDGLEVRAFPDAAAFEAWLAEHHSRREGMWVKVAKKASGIASVTEDELVDVGLCWGWISGQRRRLDDRYYLQKYGPRRPRSLWSRVNVEKVAALAAEGRMREPGLAEVRRAREDGRWDRAYASQRRRRSRTTWPRPSPRTRRPARRSTRWTAPPATWLCSPCSGQRPPRPGGNAWSARSGTWRRAAGTTDGPGQPAVSYLVSAAGSRARR